VEAIASSHREAGSRPRDLHGVGVGANGQTSRESSQQVGPDPDARSTIAFIMGTLYRGDCLDVMEQKIAAESVDIIYLDPPFFSNKKYEKIWGDEAEIRSFEDRWAGGVEVYSTWMAERLQACHRVLKPTGSLFLHCDWHAAHHLRLRLDEIFGRANFC